MTVDDATRTHSTPRRSPRCGACSTARRSPSACIAMPVDSIDATPNSSRRPTTPTPSRTTASTSANSTGSSTYLMDVHEPFAGYQRHVTTQNVDIDGDDGPRRELLPQRDPHRRRRRSCDSPAGGTSTGSSDATASGASPNGSSCSSGTGRCRVAGSIRRCRSRRASTATTCRTRARCT